MQPNMEKKRDRKMRKRTVQFDIPEPMEPPSARKQTLDVQNMDDMERNPTKNKKRKWVKSEKKSRKTSDGSSKKSNTRRRKTADEIYLLEKWFKDDKEWTKETVDFLKLNTALSTAQIYKWGWDRKKVDSDPKMQKAAMIDEFGGYCKYDPNKNDVFNDLIETDWNEKVRLLDFDWAREEKLAISPSKSETSKFKRRKLQEFTENKKPRKKGSKIRNRNASMATCFTSCFGDSPVRKPENTRKSSFEIKPLQENYFPQDWMLDSYGNEFGALDNYNNDSFHFYSGNVSLSDIHLIDKSWIEMNYSDLLLLG